MTSQPRRVSEQAARLLTLSTDPWLSCEDCFRLMDVYVEAVLAQPDTKVLPEMTVHLRGCAACAEEAESLAVLVAEQNGLDPSAAVAHLRQNDR